MLDVAFARSSDRTMKALTGLSRSAFDALLPVFADALRITPRRHNGQAVLYATPGGGGRRGRCLMVYRVWFPYLWG